jgi:hypothetical protein
VSEKGPLIDGNAPGDDPQGFVEAAGIIAVVFHRWRTLGNGTDKRHGGTDSKTAANMKFDVFLGS